MGVQRVGTVQGKGAGVVITGDLHARHRNSCRTPLLDEQTHEMELETQSRHVCTGVRLKIKEALLAVGK